MVAKFRAVSRWGIDADGIVVSVSRTRHSASNRAFSRLRSVLKRVRTGRECLGKEMI